MAPLAIAGLFSGGVAQRLAQPGTTTPHIGAGRSGFRCDRRDAAFFLDRAVAPSAGRHPGAERGSIGPRDGDALHQLACLSQSRGSVIGVVLALVVF